jgi:hypothetical protein
MASHSSAAASYEQMGKDLKADFDAGNISTAKYVEGLNQVEAGLQSEIQALQDLNEQSLNYYGNTLAKGNEEIDKSVSKMDRSTGVFDHYIDLMEILGKSKDFDVMGTFLKGKS